MVSNTTQPIKLTHISYRSTYRLWVWSIVTDYHHLLLVRIRRLPSLLYFTVMIIIYQQNGVIGITDIINIVYFISTVFIHSSTSLKIVSLYIYIEQQRWKIYNKKRKINSSSNCTRILQRKFFYRFSTRLCVASIPCSKNVFTRNN